MNSLVINKSKKAINVVFSDAKMIVFLEDGRELSNSSRMVSKIKKCNFKTITEMAFHRKRRRNTLGRN